MVEETNIQHDPPKLIERDGGRVLDLMQGDEVLQSFELVSAGLWAAFSGEGQRNLLHNRDALAVLNEAVMAHMSAEHHYRETGPLNEVEKRVAPAIENNDDDELLLLFQSPMLRSSLSDQLTRKYIERGLSPRPPRIYK